jgi:hypothetical protein
MPFLVAAAACLALAPLPMLYRLYAQKTTIQAEAKQWTDRKTSLKNLSTQVKTTADNAAQIANQISQYQKLYNSRFNWILFFSQLQNALVQTQDVWLDNLTVDREIPTALPAIGGLAATPAATATATGDSAPAAAPAATVYKLDLKGRMLLRDINPDAKNVNFNPTAASARILKMLGDFRGINFVKEVPESSYRPDFKTDPRMIGFEFTVIINPESPL